MKKNYVFAALTLCFFLPLKAQWISQAVQLMHNSSDAQVANIKLWVNDTVWANSLAFEQSTPRQSFPTGTHTMGISLITATAQSQSILQQTFAIGNGIDSQFLTFNGLQGNTSTPLSIASHTRGLEGMPSPFGGFLIFHNGCVTYPNLNVSFTPTVDFNSGTPLNSANIAYGQVARWDVNININGNSTYTISVNSGTTFVGSFLLPSTVYAGKIVNIVMNSSFNLAQKASAPGFGLAVVSATGGSVTPMTRINTPTGVNEIYSDDRFDVAVYPNPTLGTLFIVSQSGYDHKMDLLLTDLSGRTVQEQKSVISSETELNLNDLEAGIYFLNLTQDGFSKTIRLVKNQ